MKPSVIGGVKLFQTDENCPLTIPKPELSIINTCTKALSNFTPAIICKQTNKNKLADVINWTLVPVIPIKIGEMLFSHWERANYGQLKQKEIPADSPFLQAKHPHLEIV